MRLASYVTNVGGQPRAALVASDQTLVPTSELIAGGPTDMFDVLAGGPRQWERLREAASTANGGLTLSSVRLTSPVGRPRRNVFCVGWNYSEHFAEGQGMRGRNDDPVQIPDFPALFSKQPNTVIGHEEPVWHSAPISEQLDWEVELAAIIGVPARRPVYRCGHPNDSGTPDRRRFGVLMVWKPAKPAQGIVRSVSRNTMPSRINSWPGR